jgi:uncharacterized membrane protein HdeD (DUF308 family)
MTQYQPPPPGRPAGARPGAVTAAGVILIVAGALALLGGLILLVASSLGAIFALFAVIYLALGALEIYAGVQVLNLRERGRQIGLVLAGISAIVSLILIAKGPVSSVIGIALDAFIIYALYTNRQYFTA